MGYELWISKNTGVSRKGTTFQELQSLFINDITTKYIFEPIQSCKLDDDSIQVKENLEDKDFDIVGIINDDNQVIGFAERIDLDGGPIERYKKNIELTKITSDSTPISKILSVLLDNQYVFVISENNITGIVTRADINKPIVRIYLFGIISLFELHLNYWINRYYSNNLWKNKLKDKRIDMAENIFEQRKGNNEELTLLECIQLCDKKTILRSTSEFITKFNFKTSDFDKFLRNIEIIRNEISHSQNSIVSNVKWSEFVKSISDAEKFLLKSEELVKKDIHATNTLSDKV